MHWETQCVCLVVSHSTCVLCLIHIYTSQCRAHIPSTMDCVKWMKSWVRTLILLVSGWKRIFLFLLHFQVCYQALVFFMSLLPLQFDFFPLSKVNSDWVSEWIQQIQSVTLVRNKCMRRGVWKTCAYIWIGRNPSSNLIDVGSYLNCKIPSTNPVPDVRV